MKNKALSLALAGFIMATGLTLLGQSPTPTSSAKQIAEANFDKNRREAEIDSAADFQIFKKAADRQVCENIKKFSLLKEKKSFDSKEVRQLFSKKIIALQKRNNELNDRIRGYTVTKTSRWSSFKREFIRDMDQLEGDIRSIS